MDTISLLHASIVPPKLHCYEQKGSTVGPLPYIRAFHPIPVRTLSKHFSHSLSDIAPQQPTRDVRCSTESHKNPIN